MNEAGLLPFLRVVRLVLIAVLLIIGVATFFGGIEHPDSHSGTLMASAFALTGAGVLISLLLRDR